MKQRMVVVLLALVTTVACSTTKPPTNELAQTEANISQAEQVGAEEYAPLEIREARKKLMEARELNGKKKYTEARLMAERAMVDAEYAQIKALSSKAQKAVHELRESIKALQDEIRKNIKQNS